uniref:Methyltransferase FkbM domain-containing protein n=1 Tax=Sexangularia sp. CB-2014 TaxID=1486929 RepID=A0A7S1V6N2_9EUKA
MAFLTSRLPLTCFAASALVLVVLYTDFEALQQVKPSGGGTSAGTAPPDRLLTEQLQVLRNTITSQSCAYSYVEAHTMHVCTHTDGRSSVMDTRVSTGTWELDKTALFTHFFDLSRTHAPDTYFLDVGANVGYFSLLAGLHGTPALAVEAMQYNLAPLNASVVLNELRHLVTPLHVALGAEESNVELCALPRDRLASAAWTKNKGNGQVVASDGRECLEHVRVQPLDAVLLTQPAFTTSPVLFAKLDCEGCEANALVGASALLRDDARAPCLLQLEFDVSMTNATGGSPSKLAHLLQSASYVGPLLFSTFLDELSRGIMDVSAVPTEATLFSRPGTRELVFLRDGVDARCSFLWSEPWEAP